MATKKAAKKAKKPTGAKKARKTVSATTQTAAENFPESLFAHHARRYSGIFLDDPIVNGQWFEITDSFGPVARQAYPEIADNYDYTSWAQDGVLMALFKKHAEAHVADYLNDPQLFIQWRNLIKVELIFRLLREHILHPKERDKFKGRPIARLILDSITHMLAQPEWEDMDFDEFYSHSGSSEKALRAFRRFVNSYDLEQDSE